MLAAYFSKSNTVGNFVKPHNRKINYIPNVVDQGEESFTVSKNLSEYKGTDYLLLLRCLSACLRFVCMIISRILRFVCILTLPSQRRPEVRLKQKPGSCDERNIIFSPATCSNCSKLSTDLLQLTSIGLFYSSATDDPTETIRFLLSLRQHVPAEAPNNKEITAILIKNDKSAFENEDPTEFTCDTDSISNDANNYSALRLEQTPKQFIRLCVSWRLALLACFALLLYSPFGAPMCEAYVAAFLSSYLVTIDGIEFFEPAGDEPSIFDGVILLDIAKKIYACLRPAMTSTFRSCSDRRCLSEMIVTESKCSRFIPSECANRLPMSTTSFSNSDRTGQCPDSLRDDIGAVNRSRRTVSEPCQPRRSFSQRSWQFALTPTRKRTIKSAPSSCCSLNFDL